METNKKSGGNNMQKLTKREKELLLNIIATGIYHKKWNFDIKRVYDSKGNKTNSFTIIPMWIEKDEEEYGKRELTISIHLSSTVILSYAYRVKDNFGFERSCVTVFELLDLIQDYYDLED